MCRAVSSTLPYIKKIGPVLPDHPEMGTRVESWTWFSQISVSPCTPSKAVSCLLLTPSVRRNISFVDFRIDPTPTECAEMTVVLHAVRHNLERLLFDVVITKKSLDAPDAPIQSLLQTIVDLPELHELCLLSPYRTFNPSPFDPIVGAHIRKVRRLFLFGTFCNCEIPGITDGTTSSLETVFLAFPLVSSTFGTPGESVVRQLRGLTKHMILLLPQSMGNSWGLLNQLRQHLERELEPQGPSVGVAKDLDQYLIEVLGKGDIWGVAQRTWDEHVQLIRQGML